MSDSSKNNTSGDKRKACSPNWFQMPPLIAISEVIGPVHSDYMPADDQEDSNMPVYIDNTVANNNDDNDDANDDANEDDEVDDDGGAAAEGHNDD